LWNAVSPRRPGPVRRPATPVEAVVAGGQRLVAENEYEADRFAAQTTADPEELVGALKKLSVQNLTNLTPHPWHVALHYSHPPLLQRIAALRAGRG
jgi:STE24 endopeptidase